MFSVLRFLWWGPWSNWNLASLSLLSLCMDISDGIEVAKIAMMKRRLHCLVFNNVWIVHWRQKDLPKIVASSEFFFCLFSRFHRPSWRLRLKNLKKNGRFDGKAQRNLCPDGTFRVQRRSLFRVQSTSTRGKCHSAIKSDPTKQVNNQLISFWVILESDQ